MGGPPGGDPFQLLRVTPLAASASPQTPAVRPGIAVASSHRGGPPGGDPFQLLRITPLATSASPQSPAVRPGIAVASSHRGDRPWRPAIGGTARWRLISVASSYIACRLRVPPKPRCSPWRSRGVQPPWGRLGADGCATAESYSSIARSRTMASLTTVWPGVSPNLISCRPSGRVPPATTSTRRNW